MGDCRIGIGPAHRTTRGSFTSPDMDAFAQGVEDMAGATLLIIIITRSPMTDQTTFSVSHGISRPKRIPKQCNGIDMNLGRRLLQRRLQGDVARAVLSQIGCLKILSHKNVSKN